MNASVAVFWLVVAIVLAPVVAAGSLAALPPAIGIVAVLLAARWIVREYLDVYKSQQFGKASDMRPTDMASRGDLDERTSQDMTGDDDDGKRWQR